MGAKEHNLDLVKSLKNFRKWKETFLVRSTTFGLKSSFHRRVAFSSFLQPLNGFVQLLLMKKARFVYGKHPNNVA